MITAARIAWAACALTLALIACAAVLAGLNGYEPITQSHLLLNVACALAGGLIGAHRPGHPVGRLLALSALCFALLESCGEYAVYGALTRPAASPGHGPLPLAEAMAWSQTWLWIPANFSLALVPLFFPGDAPPSPRWRPFVRAVVAAAAAGAAVNALRPGTNEQVGPGPGVPNPLGVAVMAGPAQVMETALVVLLAVVFAAGGIDLLVRARRSTGRQRAQVKWLAYAVALSLLAAHARLAAGLADDDPRHIYPPVHSPWELVGALATALIPVAICIAILRHRLFDIDLVVNRTLVYALLSGCVTGGYVLVVGYLGAVLPSAGLPASVLAAGLVALAFAPLRQRLQSWVNLLMYGERDDPYAALTRLGRRLEASEAPDAVLPGVARSVAEALRLPYAAVETADGERHAWASAGEGVPGGAVRLPLTYDGARVGDLVLSPRPGESGFGPRDLRVLSDLARQVAVAAHAVRLSADLRRSRERLVMAREEERRRLRRDLHDGLGPTLAALTMRAEAAHDLVTDGRARDLLAGLVRDAEAATADVRTLVDGLRPPALDSLGLLGALRVHAARQPPGLRVTVEAPDELPPLPAATEVAAYRIAAEALANVGRHAGAAGAELRIAVAGDSLVLEVLDDGGLRPAVPGPDAPPGAPSKACREGGREDSGREGVEPKDAGPEGTGREGARREGVGLVSMRERAAELGGSCTVEERAEGGTRVRVVLPAREEGRRR
ncbi:histidine kinase [Planomonospora sphaerica]|uniref:histidine kinase n=1 Tax=Planomonospora sphaerica TaxID=161355 RepID=A0A171BK80_9ACTN|nr:histidine kinase [Planomonospora sphaerica]GAT65220.1 histidine kinase [Planomonospora sphaerica]